MIKKRDIYNISYGNLQVLRTIPEMMQDKEWRKKLRIFVSEYNFNQTIKAIKSVSKIKVK